jgi:hypothetical protein
MNDAARYEVVWPLGKIAGAPMDLATCSVDLNGKTVGELWDGVFRGDQVFPVLREQLRKRFPDIKFVEHATLGKSYGNVKDYIAKLPALLKENGCDVVISGVGG